MIIILIILRRYKKMTTQKTCLLGRFFHGRGGRNRTLANGFGDRCTTTIRHPHKNPACAGSCLLRFFMHGVLLAVLAVFLHFQTILQCLFILAGKVVHMLTFGALQLDHVVL